MKTILVFLSLAVSAIGQTVVQPSSLPNASAISGTNHIIVLQGTTLKKATVGQTLYRVVSVPYGATVTPNADTTEVLIVGALTGDITIAAPSGTPTDGQRLTLRLIQDGTGGRIATFNAAFRVPTGDWPELDLTASKLTRYQFEWNAAASKWDLVSNISGY